MKKYRVTHLPFFDSDSKMTNIVPLFQALIGYIPDSKTFVNLSMTCKIANRICIQSVGQLKFKHGITKTRTSLDSKRISRSSTIYRFYENGILMCEMCVDNLSKKKMGRTTIYPRIGLVERSRGIYMYHYNKLFGKQQDTNNREWFVSKKMSKQYNIYSKEEDIIRTEKYYKSITLF